MNAGIGIQWGVGAGFYGLLVGYLYCWEVFLMGGALLVAIEGTEKADGTGWDGWGDGERGMGC